MGENGNMDGVDPVASAKEQDDAVGSPSVGQTPDVQVSLTANMKETMNSDTQGVSGSSNNQDTQESMTENVKDQDTQESMRENMIDENDVIESQGSDENQKDDNETEDCGEGNSNNEDEDIVDNDGENDDDNEDNDGENDEDNKDEEKGNKEDMEDSKKGDTAADQAATRAYNEGEGASAGSESVLRPSYIPISKVPCINPRKGISLRNIQKELGNMGYKAFEVSTIE